MKTTLKIALTVSCALALAGCSLIPKAVEFGQKKVKPIPGKTASTVEAEKKAAEFVSEKVVEAREAALVTGASTNVLVPLKEAADASQGLLFSLGAPADRWQRSGEELATLLGRQANERDRAIDKLRQSLVPLAGKKIEGSGWFQIPWIVYVLGVVLGVIVVYKLVKIGIGIAGTFYPPIGAGESGLRAVGRVAAPIITKGFHQFVAGAESYKDAILKNGWEDKVKQEALALFRTHMMSKQDQDVQTVVKGMTLK